MPTCPDKCGSMQQNTDFEARNVLTPPWQFMDVVLCAFLPHIHRLEHEHCRRGLPPEIMKSIMKSSSHVLRLALVTGLILGFARGYSHADILYVDNLSTIEKFASNGDGSIFANVGFHGTPGGIAFDTVGNLYAAQNFGIYKYNAAGVGSLYANRFGFFSPNACAFDSAGSLYVSVPNAQQILKVSTGGVTSVFASTGSGDPFGLAFDNQGSLYAACIGNNTIEKFTPAGVESDFASGGLLSAPVGLAFGANGYLYVVNQGGGIDKFSASGVGSLFSTGNLQIISQGGLAFDTLGNLYASDYAANSIYKLNSDGVSTVFASGGSLSGPRYLAFTDDRGVPLGLLIPEPSTQPLFGVGLLLLLWRSRRVQTGSPYNCDIYVDQS
jgi:DNA-binding beta-propeller fold protein YncE